MTNLKQRLDRILDAIRGKKEVKLSPEEVSAVNVTLTLLRALLPAPYSFLVPNPLSGREERFSPLAIVLAVPAFAAFVAALAVTLLILTAALVAIAIVEGLRYIDEITDKLEKAQEVKARPIPSTPEQTTPKPTPKTKTETTTDVVPATPTRTDPDDEKRPPAAMRFQVQWNSRAKDNTKGQFSEVVSAPASMGVSTIQAITALTATHAKVTPGTAKKAAEPAVAIQVRWINARPPGGVDGQFSRSEPFEYRYPDARVDVEGLRGHNLRR